MLTKSPAERISIDKIMEYSWFLKQNKPSSPQKLSIKSDIINQLEGNGFNRQSVVSDLKNRVMNDVTAAYYIVLMNGEYGEDSEQSSGSSHQLTRSRTFKDTSSYSAIPFKLRKAQPGRSMSLVPNHICCRPKFRLF